MNAQVQLRMGMYSVFIHDWLLAFPRENFLFVRLEEYSANTSTVLRDVITFLELGSFAENMYKYEP